MRALNSSDADAMMHLPQSGLFTYDKLMRLPVVLFFSFFLVRETIALGNFLEHEPVQLQVQFITSLGVQISLILFLLLLVALNLIRAQPLNKATGWQPKISALLGLSLGSLVLLLDRAAPSPGFDLASMLLLLLGNYLCIVALLHLGRSISIMAEARRLVTSGPYAIIRHPLYFAEEIALLGTFLIFRSWEAAAILILHFAFQVQRMRNEERILLATFPEYQPYMQKTARLIPGVW